MEDEITEEMANNFAEDVMEGEEEDAECEDVL